MSAPSASCSPHETLVRFLEAIAGQAGRGELLELRYRLPDRDGMGQQFFSPRELAGLATRAIALGRRTDVYLGCAPRTRRHGGRDAVRRAFALWADCDGPDAVARLGRFDPPPAIVLSTGTGTNCHAFWLLATALQREELERANRRLAHALAADLACADAARILRVPGSASHKHHPPVPVRALRLDLQTRVSAAEVIHGLPDPPQPQRSHPPMSELRRGNDPLLAIAPETYVQRLLGVQVPRDRKVPCPFHHDRQPSLHVYDTPDRGWYCYGPCRRGGTIYDLAAPLYGYQPRGQDFLRLRHQLHQLFDLEQP
jgi:RepB DNA-primase from phage plasmid/CHC2 zinc finger